MPKITFLAWNLLNFGESKYRINKGRVELISLIAKVVNNNGADLAGFTEILSNKADPIGKDLVAALNLLNPTKSWTHMPSDQFMTGTGKAKRKEQYLYLWNKNRLDPYTPGVGTSFQYKFENPVGTPLKFPGVPPSKGRPPWLGFFQTKDGTKPKIVVAIMHSPGPDNNPEAASQEMSKIGVLVTEGNYTAIMGDFNIRKNATTEDVDMNNVNSNGYMAFNKFSANFSQPLYKTESSLAGNAFVKMELDECYSNPYDQVFIRPQIPPTNGDADVDELIKDCVSPPVPAEPVNVTAPGYLEKPLADLEGKIFGPTPAYYRTVEDAFQMFRRYVSDHAPILADITYL
jgi:hypothetical protein